MKRKVLVDLIKSHYTNDRAAFFEATLQVLKEFREDGMKELAEDIEFTILPHLKVVPKEDKDSYVKEIYNPNIIFEDADVRYTVDENGNLIPKENKDA